VLQGRAQQGRVTVAIVDELQVGREAEAIVSHALQERGDLTGDGWTIGGDVARLLSKLQASRR